MEGHNTLCLCTAEVIQAIEFYLKRKVLHPEYAPTVRVTGVVSDNDTYAPGFKVSLEPVEKVVSTAALSRVRPHPSGAG